MKIKPYFYSFVLFTALIPLISFTYNKSTPNCIIDLGGDVEILLGDSVEIIFNSNCTLPVESIEWSPTSDLSCSDCLSPTSYTLDDICYTLIVTWPDGTVASDDFCIFVKGCKNQFTENKIVSISPQDITDEAVINLEIATAQNVKIETVGDCNETEYFVYEGWVRAGTPSLTLDFSGLPSGEHNLRLKMYPEDLFITINKL